MAALENAAFGIRVNAICPGPTMGTELTKNSLSTNPHEEAMLKEHVIPMKKLATTQEVVNAVLAEVVTKQVIQQDKKYL